MTIATKTYFKRTIERLCGIIEGIAIDYRINGKELGELQKWIESHPAMHDIEPFRGLAALLEDIIADEIFTKEEHNELLEWCSDIINEKGLFDNVAQATMRLHGVCQGIACDKKITLEELESLNDWLLDYEDFKNWWPFNDLTKLIKKISKDNIIDLDEDRELKEFFLDFTETFYDNPEIHDKEYYRDSYMIAPTLNIYKSISSICENNPKIIFENKKFCFTGPAASGKRKDLFETITKHGGYPVKNIVNNLDYLIIGAQASPAWIYSTYGRKIEKVINKNKKGESISIIQEVDFIKAVEAIKPNK